MTPPSDTTSTSSQAGSAEPRVPPVDELLDVAVAAIGGSSRPGQHEMAAAIVQAVETGQHLLVQAGTGTGKSLGYLVPAIAHAVASGNTVVVSTATLALQSQLVVRDLPRLAEALAGPLGRQPTWQVVKGRANYVCRHKVDGGYPSDEGDTLFDAPITPVAPGRLGAQVVRLREWASETATGEREELVPGVSDAAWRQVSVSARECLGANCPVVADCFCEQSRERSRSVDVVITNHAVVAIDAFEGRGLLPEHDVLIVDEAHELADRVTSAVTRELTISAIESAARHVRGCGVMSEPLDDAAALLSQTFEHLPEGRLTVMEEELMTALVGVRDGARDLLTAVKEADRPAHEADGARAMARADLSELFDIAERLASGSGALGGPDVVWFTRVPRPDGAIRMSLVVAPLSVAEVLRNNLLAEHTVVLTSATLAIGGAFDAVSRRLGLSQGEWRGLDVGSPFDYPKQGILYVAAHLPSPGRDGTSEQAYAELASLIEAAGGRTLGLFSSRRAAEAAAAEIRERVSVPVLCQGDDVMATLVRNFADDDKTCLFGTLSLWQGVDVPGSALQLVVIDRIPFPRPDDPLTTARQQAVAKAGGNAFMSVAAAHAALLLAQGAGRLIRSAQDRGVVAVLDSRLATARYAGFLRASLPPLWPTTERDLVVGALRRINETVAGD